MAGPGKTGVAAGLAPSKSELAVDAPMQVAVEHHAAPDLAEDPGLVPGVLLDLIMLAYAGGRERTRSEFAALLDAAGLSLHDATPLPAGPHLIEARPA